MISDKIKTYTCLSCLNNITKGKKSHASRNDISRNKIISYVTKLKCLKYCLISPWLYFAQIYEFHGYGQYKMKGVIINVPTNINQT
jgi:hypothetical protein